MKNFRWFLGIVGIAAMFAVYWKTNSVLLAVSQTFGPAFFIATPYPAEPRSPGRD